MTFHQISGASIYLEKNIVKQDILLVNENNIIISALIKMILEILLLVIKEEVAIYRQS